jgi:hypothetical protein
MKLSEAYTKAAVFYVAREPEDECYRKGCDAPAVIALTFMAEDEPGAELEESFVFLCRTHMHGFLGHFLDHGESIQARP